MDALELDLKANGECLLNLFKIDEILFFPHTTFLAAYLINAFQVVQSVVQLCGLLAIDGITSCLNEEIEALKRHDCIITF